MGTVRPDVSGFMGGIPFAIEVQISVLTIEQIIHRTTEYARQGVYVLWLALYHQSLQRLAYLRFVYTTYVTVARHCF
jgi:competence CoiA-like predicted nuclease